MNNNNLELGKRGIFRPSARRSIHNHEGYCLFRNIEMTRYGVRKSNSHSDTSSDSINEVGTDQVDCTQRENLTDPRRRNSFHNVCNTNNSDISEDEYTLAISLPARLPSHFDSRVKNNKRDQQLANHDKSISKSSDSKIVKIIHEDKQKSTKFINKQCLCLNFFAIFALAIGLLYCYAFTERSNEEGIIYNEWHFHNDLGILKDKYKINDNAILLVETGISTIFKKEDTGSFMFLHNNNLNNYKFYDFVSEVASIVAIYLRNSTTRHIEIQSSNLDMYTHNELINKYRDDLTRSGVMLVRELDQLPPNLAMAFHYYCDEYNPLAKKSAIFFTLNLENCSDLSGEKATHANIEKCLAKKWNSLPRDNIMPLLTRIVSVIVDVTNVF